MKSWRTSSIRRGNGPLLAVLCGLVLLSALLSICLRAVSGMFSAGIDAVVTFVPDALAGYSDFRIGGLANLTMGRIVPAFWVILIAFILVFSLAGELDVLMLGADDAALLSGGRLAAHGTVEEVYASGKIDEVFGIALHRVETESGWQYYYG